MKHKFLLDKLASKMKNVEYTSVHASGRVTLDEYSMLTNGVPFAQLPEREKFYIKDEHDSLVALDDADYESNLEAIKSESPNKSESSAIDQYFISNPLYAVVNTSEGTIAGKLETVLENIANQRGVEVAIITFDQQEAKAKLQGTTVESATHENIRDQILKQLPPSSYAIEGIETDWDGRWPLKCEIKVVSADAVEITMKGEIADTGVVERGTGDYISGSKKYASINEAIKDLESGDAAEGFLLSCHGNNAVWEIK